MRSTFLIGVIEGNFNGIFEETAPILLAATLDTAGAGTGGKDRRR